jgi:hypothetical protein
MLFDNFRLQSRIWRLVADVLEKLATSIRKRERAILNSHQPDGSQAIDAALNLFASGDRAIDVVGSTVESIQTARAILGTVGDRQKHPSI